MRGDHRTWLLFALLLALSEARDDDVCTSLGSTCRCIMRSLRCTSANDALDAVRQLQSSRQSLDSFSSSHCDLDGNLELDINVVNVNVSANSISHIDSGSERVQNLDVSHNQIKSLDFTRNFIHLRRLYASHNRIHHLARLRLESLAVLDLSTNEISEVSFDAFTDLRNLEVLNLNGNSLQHLRMEWFSGLSNLHQLSVASNQLTELNNLLFRSTTRLRFIDLSHNRISHVGMLSFQNLKSLVHLDLSFNKIAALSGDFCKSFDSIQVLDVSGNPLTSLANFRSLPAKNFSLIARKLAELKSIQVNDTIGLEGVTLLDLSESGLEVIEAHALDRLTRLQSLNLSHCSLSSFPKGLFLPLVALNKINLQGNSWHCDCGLKWLLFLFFHRPQLQLEGAGSTMCSSEALEGTRSRLGRQERLLDFLDRRVHCVNATVTNYTTMAHFRLGSTAMLFCDVIGTPTPSLEWYAGKPDPVDTCGKRCFQHGVCSGCHLARWMCRRQEKGCDNEECRRFAQECMRSADDEQTDGRCCTPVHLRTAIDSCFNSVVSDSVQCLQEVGTISGANFTYKDMEKCVGDKELCVLKCRENLCGEEMHRKCVEPAVSCTLDLLGHETLEATDSFHECESRICTKTNKLYISKVSRGDSGYYKCRTSNVLQTQQVTIHLTLDYDFMVDVRNYSILTGFIVAVLFTLATLIGVGVEKILQHFGLKCPCDADGPIRRQNIVKILEQVEGYRRQNLERLRENYNWQVARIKENCILQMDRVKDSYIAEQTGKIRDYGSSQIWAIKDNYIGQVQRVRDYGNGQMDWLRENYVFQRNRIHKFSKHQLIRLRENYKLQQKHLNKILETLPNLESCRKGFYSETDLTELNFTAMLVPPPPPPESVLEFPTFDEFSLPDLPTGFESRSGTILSPDDSSVISFQSERRSRKAYPTIEQVIRERLLPIGDVVAESPTDLEKKKRGHRRSYSAPITEFRNSSFNASCHPLPLAETPREEQTSPEKSSPSDDTDSRTEGSRSTAKASDVLVDIDAICLENDLQTPSTPPPPPQPPQQTDL